MNEIKMIPINKLEPHPNNPRKDLGDIKELSDSIKKVGILQNLTVVPNGDNYRVIIGHRRLAAAKEAGLTELPVVITEMDEKTQQQTMLTENLQRADLTIIEQAEGFQLLLDLGTSVKEIAEETGFSEPTIRHRLNINKLDKEKIKELIDDGIQLRLTDFIALEKVQDIEIRNELLENIGDSDFGWHVDREVNREIKRALNDRLKMLAEKAGLKEEKFLRSWDKGFEKVKNYISERDFDIETLADVKNVELPEGAECYGIDEYGGTLCFYSHKTKEELEQEKEEESNKEMSEWEIYQETKKAILKDISKIEDGIKQDVVSYVTDQIDKLDNEKSEELLVNLLNISLGEKDLEKAPKTLKEVILKGFEDRIKRDYLVASYSSDGKISAWGHDTFDKAVEIIKPLGFNFTEDQQALLNNEHDLQHEISAAYDAYQNSFEDEWEDDDEYEDELEEETEPAPSIKEFLEENKAVSEDISQSILDTDKNY